MSTVKWSRLDQQGPILGFETKVRVVPLKGEKRGPDTPRLSAASNCRELLIDQIQEEIGRQLYKSVQYRSSWGFRCFADELAAEIDLGFEDTHQPDVTKLWINLPKYHLVRRGSHQFPQWIPPSYTELIQIADAVTGLVCLILNPDRYCGNWWRTTAQDAMGTRPGRFVWYGTDNFFLAHPALTSIVFGLFRQSLQLVRAGQASTLSTRAPRAEVRKALDQSDHERALYLVKKLKPLIASPVKTRRYPIRSTNFDFLFDLHKAIYKHGFEKVFGAPSKPWNFQVIYSDGYGSYDYFGASASTNTARRIKRLARQ